MYRRYFYLLTGIAIAGVSIAAVAQAGLGISPISTLPYVLSTLTDYSFGTMNFVVNVVFVLLQIAILRSRFRLFSLLQIPFVFLFSASIDIGMWIVSYFPMTTYPVQLAVSIGGNFFMALAIGLMVVSRLLLMPGDGFVLALSDVTGNAYGNIKMINDISMVVIAAILGMCTMGYVVGVREGTVISAFLVGWCLKRLLPILQRYLDEKSID